MGGGGDALLMLSTHKSLSVNLFYSVTFHEDSCPVSKCFFPWARSPFDLQLWQLTAPVRDLSLRCKASVSRPQRSVIVLALDICHYLWLALFLCLYLRPHHIPPSLRRFDWINAPPRYLRRSIFLSIRMSSCQRAGSLRQSVFSSAAIESGPVEKCDALFIPDCPQRFSGAFAVRLEVLARAKKEGICCNLGKTRANKEGITSD